MLEAFSTETLEAIQDITEIQKITGEKRLLDGGRVGFELKVPRTVH